MMCCRSEMYASQLLQVQVKSQVICCKSNSNLKSFVASPSQVTSHLLQVQFKSQVICCKSKSSYKCFGHRASEVKSQVSWPLQAIAQVQVKSQVILTPVKSSHKSSQIKSSHKLPHNVWLACIYGAELNVCILNTSLIDSWYWWSYSYLNSIGLHLHCFKFKCNSLMQFNASSNY